MTPADSMRQAEEDRRIAAEVKVELSAQMAILRILKPLNQDQRKRVFEAIGHLVTADGYVPGLLERFLEGRT